MHAYLKQKTINLVRQVIAAICVILITYGVINIDYLTKVKERDVNNTVLQHLKECPVCLTTSTFSPWRCPELMEINLERLEEPIKSRVRQGAEERMKSLDTFPNATQVTNRHP